MRKVALLIIMSAFIVACGDDTSTSQPTIAAQGGAAATPATTPMSTPNANPTPTPTPTPTPMAQNVREQCNGADDDKDNKVDEGLAPRACSNQCGPGTETCTNGAWVCTLTNTPMETCDGADNDCDGNTDEQTNETCMNACGAMGEKVCTNGVLSECNAPAVAPDTCDGVDNDCDGMADEGLPANCEATCVDMICQNGRTVMCQRDNTAPEECGNMRDDDCDGNVDENCAGQGGCNPANTASVACSANIGACEEGRRTCQDNSTFGPCVRYELAEGMDQPTPVLDENDMEIPVLSPGERGELCNNIDDDCDGRIDEGLDPATIANNNVPCASDVGECVPGRLTACEEGQATCEGSVLPSAEVCDMKDNDCDGTTDEGLEGAVDVCDTIDNDCDGQVDENADSDPFEGDLTNDECQNAFVLGTFEQDFNVKNWSGQHDANDTVDHYTALIEEGNNLCVPFTGVGAKDYKITVAVAGDEDQQYRVCTKFVVGNGPGLGDACGGNGIDDCIEGAGNMEFTKQHTTDDRCGSTQDTRVVIKVEAVNVMACGSYTLSLTSKDN